MDYMHEANRIADALRGRGSERVAVRRTLSRKPAEPTPRNLEVLAFMREFFADNDQLSPVMVVARHFGWTSARSADVHIQSLIHHGLLERNVLGKLRFARRAH